MVSLSLITNSGSNGSLPKNLGLKTTISHKQIYFKELTEVSEDSFQGRIQLSPGPQGRAVDMGKRGKCPEVTVGTTVMCQHQL